MSTSTWARLADLLFAGLLIWLALVVRSVRPALKKPGESKQLLWLFLMSAARSGSSTAPG
jgi:nitric oxide reductase large subunit